MKINRIKKTVSAVLSVLMIQMVNTDCFFIRVMSGYTARL